jgi:hypothetical protein
VTRPDDGLTPEERIDAILTREDAVKSQLDTAIWLWFLEELVGPIHALTDNALTIFNDVGGKVGKESHFYSKEMHKILGREVIKRVSNFLKHGSKDPKAAIKFRPGGTEYLMFDAINSCAKLYPPVSLLMATFVARFVTFHHARGRLSTEEIIKYLPNGVRIEEISPLSRRKFLEMVLPLFAEGGFPDY